MNDRFSVLLDDNTRIEHLDYVKFFAKEILLFIAIALIMTLPCLIFGWIFLTYGG